MIYYLKKHCKYYVMEGFGLFIFMVSACFFNAKLESLQSSWHSEISDPKTRLLIMAIAMAVTAAFIFFSPLTAPSGAFINPAVTLMRYRLGQITWQDLLWYSLFQTIGGLLGVYLTYFFMGNILSDPPVNYSVTVPGKDYKIWEVAGVETLIAFIMITMVLFTTESKKLQKYTSFFAAILVGCFVYFAGPISGFGMNPSRTIASAIPANIYTSFWIYMICPVVGMLLAAEFYLFVMNYLIRKHKHDRLATLKFPSES